MRLLLAIAFIVTLAAQAHADGPILKSKDADTQQEFDNVYQTIRNPNIQNGTAQKLTISTGILTNVTITSATISNETVVTSTITNLTVTNLFGFSSGKVKQMVFATSTSQFGTTSNTFQTTNCSATITPTSATSRILVIASGDIRSTNAGISNAYGALYRGSTSLGGGSDADNGTLSAASGSLRVPATYTTTDSPASTSALTYSVKIANDDNTTLVNFVTASKCTMTLVEIAP